MAEYKPVPLSQFIIENIEPLLDDWVQLASKHLSTARPVEISALRSGSRRILLAIAADMADSQSDQQRKDKATGDRPENAPAMTRAARDHAEQHFDFGFTLTQLIAEYRAVRANVIRHWTRALQDAGPELEQLVRFGEAVDQSLIEAVDLFDERVRAAGDIFVGMLGHDLRNPLNAAVAGNSLQDLLSADRDEQHAVNERVTISLLRMSDMVDGIADFAQTRLGGKLSIWPERVDLADVCRETVGMFQDSYAEQVFKISCRGDLEGHWDPSRLKQLLANLISNALSYGDQGAPIRITASADGDDVLLSVNNEGAPIPVQQQTRIFNPMVRAHDENRDTGKRTGRSLGLGLYIVKAITSAHGGKVAVISDVESGTTFSVRLPRSVTTDSSSPP